MPENDTHVFCSFEMASFPAEQFERHPEYGQIHSHPPGDAPKHTTLGQVLPSEEGAVQTWSLPSQAYR